MTKGNMNANMLKKLDLSTYAEWLVGYTTPTFQEEDPVPASSLTLGRLRHNENINGRKFFARILPDQKNFQPRSRDLIYAFVNLRTLVHHCESDLRLPGSWIGKALFGWKSVARANDGNLWVPYLDCDCKPEIAWRLIDCCSRASDYDLVQK